MRETADEKVREKKKRTIISTRSHLILYNFETGSSEVSLYLNQLKTKFSPNG